jgi:hypothetical protein
VNIYVSDELREKMRRWDNRYNWSLVFENAVLDVLEANEVFEEWLRTQPKAARIRELVWIRARVGKGENHD